MKVYPYEAIDISMEATSIFKVNGSRLKHYYVGELINGKVSYNLPKCHFFLASIHSQAHDLKGALFGRHPRTLFLVFESNKEEVFAKNFTKKFCVGAANL